MNNLKTFRKINKITQAELAKVLGTSQKQISMYETGERELRENQIIEICKHYHVSANFLLGITEGET